MWQKYTEETISIHFTLKTVLMNKHRPRTHRHSNVGPYLDCIPLHWNENMPSTQQGFRLRITGSSPIMHHVKQKTQKALSQLRPTEHPSAAFDPTWFWSYLSQRCRSSVNTTTPSIKKYEWWQWIRYIQIPDCASLVPVV